MLIITSFMNTTDSPLDKGALANRSIYSIAGNGDVILIGGGENFIAIELGAKMAAISLLRMIIGRQRGNPSLL